jgi:hypothetical protein
MKTWPSKASVGNRLHQRYQEHFVGTGARVEFFLKRSVVRPENLAVYVDGVRQRVSERGAAHDYSIRGITAGYSGDRNAIRFVVAPLLNVDVIVENDAT